MPHHFQNEFMKTVQPHLPDLSRYCRMTAGTPWDGEDLLQETLIKAFQSAAVFVNHPEPKAYLFRIAANAWIDHCRKNKAPLDPYREALPLVQPHGLDFEIREAMEELFCHLPPRQASVLLLTEVFGFSAQSAASMLEMTEGAVKAALHRARTTLKRVKRRDDEVRSRFKAKSVAELADIFLDAFQQHDPAAVSRAYRSLKHRGMEAKRIIGEGMVFFQLRDPDGNVFTVAAPAKKIRNGS